VAQVPVTRISRNAHRQRVHARVRRKVHGTPERPRLAVFRSLQNISAQVIDDTAGRPLISASSGDKETRKETKSGGNVAGAKVVGRVVAERALKSGVTQVVFDRGGYAYHGRVKALAEAARAAGLKF